MIRKRLEVRGGNEAELFKGVVEETKLRGQSDGLAASRPLETSAHEFRWERPAACLLCVFFPLTTFKCMAVNT